MADNVDIVVNCPACDKPMKKIYMSEQGINLDVCADGCGGVFFDNREFNKFDENHEDISPLIKVFEGKEFDKVDTTKKRTCPLCGSPMVKNYTSVKKEIEVDECYSCGGKFLDNGELEKVRAQYDTEEERVADVIKSMYSAVGMELSEIEKKYAKMQLKPSLLSRFIIK